VLNYSCSFGKFISLLFPFKTWEKKDKKKKKIKEFTPQRCAAKNKNKQKPKTLNEESQYEKVGNKVRVFTLF